MRTFALSIVQRLRDAGFIALWAGGCVRDMLLGATPHDYDVATDAIPPQVRRLFRKSLSIGAQFGVIEILGDEPGLHVQVATFRSDGKYTDGRHPDSVRFGTPEEDAQRRDFTINGLFFDPLKDHVIDYVGGKVDLEQKLVRAIGNPHHRIEEDKLRMLRAVRFVSRLGFQLDEATSSAIIALHKDITQVSAERITEELKKMLTHRERSYAATELTRLRLLPTLLPEFDWSPLTDYLSGPFPLVHHLPSQASFPLAWTALLMDIQGELRPKQAITQSEIRDAFGRRFRLSQAEIAHVEYLMSSFGKGLDAQELPWSILKPLLAHPHRDDLLALLEAYARCMDWTTLPGLDYARDRLQVWSQEQLEPAPLVTGEDVARLGIPAGPRYKQLLDAVRTAQLNEEITNRPEAIELLEKLAGMP